MLVSTLPSVSRLDYMPSLPRYEGIIPNTVLADATRGAKDGEAEVGV